MDAELNNAWKEVLFWAKRLSYLNADKHPKWRENYEEAKKELAEIKARKRREQLGY